MAATLFVNTWSGATGTGAIQLISANHWNYLRVTNTGTGFLYVTTDGVVSVSGLTLTGNTAPATGVDNGWTVEAGETVIVPTKQAMWWQGFGGPNGNINGVGLNNYSNYFPPQNIDSKAPNPGTGVTLVASATSTAAVEGAG